MTLPGTDYLLRLATLAVAFVGWSAVMVTLRKALGAELSGLHMYYVRFFIEGGLLAAAFCLLPAVLSFTGLSALQIWRISSIIAAFIYTIYLIFLYRRRRRVVRGKVPPITIVFFSISILATLALWVNAVGIHFQSGAAIYAICLSWLLVVGGLVFVQNLDLFFGNKVSKKRT